MLGNVFSPAYAAARARSGAVDPLRFPAVNVAVYGAGVRRWVLTERDAGAVRRSPAELAIGQSALRWEGGDLRVTLDERSSPFGARVAGTLKLTPRPGFEASFVPLDVGGRHRWTPIAPAARVEVDLAAPRVSFRGHAYLDANWGDEALEAAFSRWSWWRVEDPGGGTRVGYRVEPRRGAPLDVSCRIDADGAHSVRPAGPQKALGRTWWGVLRGGEPGMEIVRTLEDTPFYARSLVRVGRAIGVHETVSLDRFASPWVQRLIPYRMRREVTSP
jgi:carotenoid 1,2-hydratase